MLVNKNKFGTYSGTAGVLVSAVVPEGLRVLPGHATHWPPVMLRHSMPIPIRRHTRDGLQGEILVLCYFSYSSVLNTSHVATIWNFDPNYSLPNVM